MNKKNVIIIIILILFTCLFMTFKYYKSDDRHLELNKNEFKEYEKHLYKGYERIFLLKEDNDNIYIKVQRNYSFVPIKKHYDFLILNNKDFNLSISNYSDKNCNTIFVEKNKLIYCLNIS